MRRLLSFVFAFLIATSLLTVGVYAEQSGESRKNIITFDDGSYIIVKITVSGVRSSTVTGGEKTYTYYNSNDEAVWSANLFASFRHDGSTSTCIAAGSEITIINDNWYEISKSVTKDGNSAILDLTMGYKLLGITTTRKSISVTLSCDPDGNLS